jgi:DNA-binding response OmpR family regulator
MTELMAANSNSASKNVVIAEDETKFAQVLSEYLEHFKNLRKKIALVILDRTVIHSIYGIGYKFDM